MYGLLGFELHQQPRRILANRTSEATEEIAQKVTWFTAFIFILLAFWMIFSEAQTEIAFGGNHPKSKQDKNKGCKPSNFLSNFFCRFRCTVCEDSPWLLMKFEA
jgi:hypothetical protein